MAVERVPVYTVEEYLALEREAADKSEYVGGLIYAMAGGSPSHNAIAFNLAGELRSLLRGGPCRGFTSDQRLDAGGMITYPDVTVVCGQPAYRDDRQDTLTNPTLVVEVLSDSTEAYDRGLKFTYYRQVTSLQEVVFVAQDSPHVEVYRRTGTNGEWALSEATGLDAGIELRSLACKLRLGDIYDGVELPEAPRRPQR